jgi:hypothetical protein
MIGHLANTQISIKFYKFLKQLKFWNNSYNINLNGEMTEVFNIVLTK